MAWPGILAPGSLGDDSSSNLEIWFPAPRGFVGSRLSFLVCRAAFIFLMCGAQKLDLNLSLKNETCLAGPMCLPRTWHSQPQHAQAFSRQLGRFGLLSATMGASKQARQGIHDCACPFSWKMFEERQGLLSSPPLTRNLNLWKANVEAYTYSMSLHADGPKHQDALLNTLSCTYAAAAPASVSHLSQS